MVRSVLQSIFPPITDHYSTKATLLSDQNLWYAEGRACHPEFYDRYFTLVIDEGTFSLGDLLEFIESGRSKHDFTAACSAFDQRNLLSSAINQLESIKDKIPSKNLLNVISVLFDLSHPYEKPRIFDPESFSTAVFRISYFGFLRLNSSTRAAAFIRLISKVKNLYTPLSIINAESSSHSRSPTDHQFLFSKAELKNIIKEALQRLESFADNNSLLDHPQLIEIFGNWLRLDATRAKTWIQGALVKPDDYARTLHIFASTSTSESEGTKYSIKLSSIEEVIPVRTVEEKLKRYNPKNLNERDRKSFGAFRLALKRRAEGKADIDGRALWEEEEERKRRK